MANKYPFTEAEVITAYRTSAAELARRAGYKLKDLGEVYKIEGFGGLCLWKTGGYYCHSTGEKGSNVDFLISYCGAKSKSDAIALLLKEANVLPQRNIIATRKPKEKLKSPKGEMNMPVKSDTYKHLFAYLIQRRALSPKIVKELVKQKMMYEDVNNNVVFVAYDSDGKPKYSMQKGTGMNKFAIEVKESDKDYGWYMKGRSDTLFVFESPIDAMSHASIVQLAGGDWTQDYRLSLAGLSDRALFPFLKNNPQIKTIVLCLDNDYKSVDKRTGELVNHGQRAVETIAKKYSLLGYRIKRLLPQMPFKDFNEHLQSFIQANPESYKDCY